MNMYRIRCLDLKVFNQYHYRAHLKKGNAGTHGALRRAFLRTYCRWWDNDKGYYIKYKFMQSQLVIEARIYERSKYNKRRLSLGIKNLYKQYPLGTYARDILINPYLMQFKKPPLRIE